MYMNETTHLTSHTRLVLALSLFHTVIRWSSPNKAHPAALLAMLSSVAHTSMYALASPTYAHLATTAKPSKPTMASRMSNALLSNQETLATKPILVQAFVERCPALSRTTFAKTATTPSRPKTVPVRDARPL